MAIYYLDVDDEITSAAARIRDSSDNRIVLVLAGGSRVATSRINFRLLAGEAKRRNKRLAIVAADQSVQSVVRSAGLPVFATVGDYERAEAGRAGGVSAVAGAAAGAGLDDQAAAPMPPPGGRTAVASAGSRGSNGSGRSIFDRRFGAARVPLSVIVGLLAVVVLVVGLGAFFFYPSATVVLTLREEPVGPLALSVTVDPTVASPNDQAATVPGVNKAFPVAVSGSFDATGQNSVDTPATGTVTFTSINTVFSVPVIAGTQVSTAGGIAFVTTKTVTLARADFATRTSADAPIQAVQAGIAGNVPAGRIVKLPSDLAVAQVTVTNKSATTGGTHTVTPMIVQADIDNAEKYLTSQLSASFQDALAAPDAVPTGSDLFGISARLGISTFSPDPQGLLNQPLGSFDLNATATGTAVMADLSTVSKLAERRIRGSVKSGYTLVDGSIATQLGTAAAQGEAIAVPVTATAKQTRNLDVGELRAAIEGKSVDEARTYLSQFGKVDISVSPGWASTMPSFDFRIDVELATASPAPTVVPSPSPSTAPSNPGVTLPPGPVRTPAPTPPGAASSSPSLVPSASPSIAQSQPAATPSPSPGGLSPSPSAT
jgi:hypothetical protein